MRQPDLFSAPESSTKRINIEFKSALSCVAITEGGTIGLDAAEKPTGLVWKGVPDFAQLRTG